VRVLLPGYGPRFGNLDFRRFAEQVIRAETPAHILPTVCWINRAKMKAFESAYFEWLGAKDRATPASRARALAALYRTLFEARNTYPQQRLHSPAPGDDRPTFRLGHSALGSDETEDGPAAPT